MTTIRLLIAHRKETYHGQFAPEILAGVDEWTLDENPDYWVEKVAAEKAEQDDDVNAWAEVEIELNTADLMAALYPNPEIRTGAVIAVQELDR